ncbi:MAG: L-serine ammonia-lyase, iron-sulfur-dependent, subunit alpha [Sphaerochaetaceae bacterium]
MKIPQFLQLLKKELMIAMGCTEPAAAALAGAKARELLQEPLLRLEIQSSRDMMKNAMGVGLPNCSLRGIQAAVALGAAGGDVSLGLGILSEISDQQKEMAIQLAAEGKIALTLVEGVPPVYISVTAYGAQHVGQAVVSGEHTRFSKLRLDNTILSELPLVSTTAEEEADENLSTEMIANLSLEEIAGAVSKIDPREFEFVLSGAQTNFEMAKHGMSNGYGLSVGKVMGEGLPEEPQTLRDAYTLGAVYAAAASDARMAGCPLPVVINSGSGNQGITVSVPLLVMGTYLKVEENNLIRALCLSHLVALVLTAKKDRLSALCGAFTAAIGTACGLVYLQGGSIEAMDRSVNNMVGNLTGIICDGAKGTCALKIYSSVEAAGVSTKLALRGFSPSDESGIVGEDALQSFAYLTQISSEGMEQTDRTILAIMMGKQEICNR